MVLRMSQHLSVFVTLAIVVQNVTLSVIIRATVPRMVHATVDLMVTEENFVRPRNVPVMMYLVLATGSVILQPVYAVARLVGSVSVATL